VCLVCVCGVSLCCGVSVYGVVYVWCLCGVFLVYLCGVCALCVRDACVCGVCVCVVCVCVVCVCVV